MTSQNKPIVVLISAGSEWQATLTQFPHAKAQASPLGQWFQTELTVKEKPQAIIFFHGGWGKIAAAASTQYVIDRWAPTLLLNFGTCGGFVGEVEAGEILLVERTLVYDIVEQMGDTAAAMAHYSTELDLSWLQAPYPLPVRRSLLVSADKDIIPSETPALKEQFKAIAGDWESGAIAFVAARNKTRCLILRGVSDLVGTESGEAYGNHQLWQERTAVIMQQLIASLPAWLAQVHS